MSIIFGIKKADGDFVSERHLLDMSQTTKRWAPDGCFVQPMGSVGMGFQPYHTHRRSKLESHPVIDSCGNMVSMDGRLDNHKELCNLLDIREPATPDSLIVLAAFTRWGTECFSRLIGDWALAIWSSQERTLFLARDHAGTRTLYFEERDGILRWSTYLETFFDEHTSRELDPQYAASYMACHPTGDLTPYKGIKAITPAHTVAFHPRGQSRKAHWNWMTKEKLVYRSDSDYEEHFLCLFRQSVERRVGDGAPVLAQLSGGIDSSSIVCMADLIRREVADDAEILDTVSFFDDSEPAWDESPYFSLVEAARGKEGLHVQTSFLDKTFQAPLLSSSSRLLPGHDGSTDIKEQSLLEMIEPGGYRAILSGVGGDEFYGGVPTAIPELADYLASGRVGRFVRSAIPWCIAERTPLGYKAAETVRYLWSMYGDRKPEAHVAPDWFAPQLATLLEKPRCYVFPQVRHLGLAPSSLSNGLAWWSVVDALPNRYPPFFFRPEYRYPFLDRDLIDFIFRIPREQLVRPGRRRALMRKALAGVVPSEILERRRKAFVLYGPLLAPRNARKQISSLYGSSALASSFIDLQALERAIDRMLGGQPPRWLQPALRSISYMFWLRSIGPRLTVPLPTELMPMSQ